MLSKMIPDFKAPNQITRTVKTQIYYFLQGEDQYNSVWWSEKENGWTSDETLAFRTKSFQVAQQLLEKKGKKVKDSHIVKVEQELVEDRTWMVTHLEKRIEMKKPKLLESSSTGF